jgi:hypothetical protein
VANFVAGAAYLALAVGVRQFLTWAGPRWVFGRVAASGR